MTEYVLGFLFSANSKSVLLIKKKRPEWQAGKLNGVGGHVEVGENPHAAMERETLEETGLHIRSWTQFATLTGGYEGPSVTPVWSVQVFRAFDDKVFEADSITDETICVLPVSGIKGAEDGGLCLQNLTWLVPLALDSARKEGGPIGVDIDYE